MKKRLTPVCSEYWINKGQTEDEAQATVRELQRKRSSARKRKYANYFKIGMEFGKWTVTSDQVTYAKDGKSHVSFVEVRCICGNPSAIPHSDLINGHSKGCRKCQGMRGASNPKWSGHKDLTGTLVSHIKNGAKNRNIAFSVSSEYLYELFHRQHQKCALTGELMTWSNTSLDRIDGDGDYTIGNVQWVLKQVNIMKHILSEDEFVKLCRKVVNFHDA